MKIIEVEDKNGWKDSGYNNWNEVLVMGWQFKEVNDNGTILMYRNGYFNNWRQTEKHTEQSPDYETISTKKHEDWTDLHGGSQ